MYMLADMSIVVIITTGTTLVHVIAKETTLFFWYRQSCVLSCYHIQGSLLESVGHHSHQERFQIHYPHATFLPLPVKMS